MKLTKEWFEKWKPCLEGVIWFERNFDYGANAIEVIRALIRNDKLQDANWTIVRCMKYKQYVSYAVFASEQVVNIYEKKYPNDERLRKAIESAKKCIKNNSRKNRDAAANAAVYAGYAAHAAAYAATYAAHAASYDAVDAAAYAATYAAVYAVDAAAYAAVDAAADTVYADVKKKLRLKILEYGLKLLEEK
jgi:hypothetical protein